MFKYFKKSIKKILGLIGFDVVVTRKGKDTAKNITLETVELVYPKDVSQEKEFIDLYEKCKDYTQTSIDDMYSLHKAVEYVVKNNIDGDFVECGVAQGGSSMMIAYSLLSLEETDRNIYLYDTYAGMTEPGEFDVRLFDGKPTHDRWARRVKGDINLWCYSPLEDVQKNMLSTGYPENKLLFIKGDVKDTIPKIVPDKISILRLDTDWYESSRHELEHLFPRLSKNGVLIIDDYGYWQGNRKAVDDYFKNKNIHLMLNRVGDKARIGINT